jgi:hypothetical protein
MPSIGVRLCHFIAGFYFQRDHTLIQPLVEAVTLRHFLEKFEIVEAFSILSPAVATP